MLEYKLSPSSLNLLSDCPRCFWLKMVKKIPRPMGLMSSIPIKMDSIIKHYFDRYRNLGELPPIIEGMVTGKLPEGMPKTLTFDEGNGLLIWGRPDDYFELPDGCIIPFDHKTKSKEPENVHDAYQLQMDVYSYLLQKLGFKTVNKAYLSFYYPDECDLHNGMPFHCKILEVVTHPLRVTTLLQTAFNILTNSIPQSNKNCIYCKWTEQTSKDKWQVNKKLDEWLE